MENRLKTKKFKTGLAAKENNENCEKFNYTTQTEITKWEMFTNFWSIIAKLKKKTKKEKTLHSAILFVLVIKNCVYFNDFSLK